MSGNESELSTGVDILLSLIAMSLVLIPRFNQWPGSDQQRYAGNPRDYIHWERYSLFALIYLGSFSLFAVAFNMIPIASQLFPVDTPAVAGEVKTILGSGSSLLPVMIALAALSNKKIAELDDLWRGCLLNLARVPRDTFRLKQQILLNLPSLQMKEPQLSALLSDLEETGNPAYWQRETRLGEQDTSVGLLAQALLRALYLVAMNRMFELSLLDNRNLDRQEDRLREIAAMLPSLAADTPQFHDYRKEVDSACDTLVENLARASICHYPDADRLFGLLYQMGFNLEYEDERDISLIYPTLNCLLLTALACLIALFIGLNGFDLLHLSRSGGANWMNTETFSRWGLGNIVSYWIATAIGVVFGTVIKQRSQALKGASLLVAFLFSMLGSCVYFTIVNELLRPPLIWLAISFGLISSVAIIALNEDPLDRAYSMRRSLQLALMYGLVSGVLQALIAVSFAFNTGTSQEPAKILAFFAYGTLRGFLVAFAVSYILMEFERLQICDSRRRYPRISFRRIVTGNIAGQTTNILVKDISDRGACMQVSDSTPVHTGDTIALEFGEGAIEGTVLWSHRQKARVKFNCDSPHYAGWLAFVQRKLAPAG